MPTRTDRVFLDRVDQLLEQKQDFLPLLRALGEEFPPGRRRREMRRLIRQLENETEAEELCQSRETIAGLLPLIAAKGSAQDAGRRLNEWAIEAVREEGRRRQRRRVIAYPLTVLLMSMLVLVFICLTVVPVFDEIFTNFGLQLPALTQVVVLLSRTLRSPLIGLLLGCLSVAVGVCFLLAHIGFLRSVFGFFTGGNSRELATTGFFLRRLAEGISANLPLPVALRIAGVATPSAQLRKASHRLAQDATHFVRQDGGPLSESSAARLFPATMTHLLTVTQGKPTVGGPAEGEAAAAERNAAACSLLALSDTLLERVNKRFEAGFGSAAQFSILVVGVVVGVVLLALLLPLVTLVNGLT